MNRRVVNAASVLSAAILFVAPAAGTGATTLVVCPDGSNHADCRFKGDLGIQAAVDAAVDGDTVLIRAGKYSPAAYRDVPYKEVRVRGYVVIDGKQITLAGEPGTVLDGSRQRPASAIVIRHGDVAIRQLEITGFRYDVEEDDIYDGHGVFVIDGRVRLDDVTIRGFQKMGLTGRGLSLIDAANLRVLNGHVGVWVTESSYLRLHDAIIAGNDSAAIAAYGNAVVHASNAAFDGNRDDGLFADGQAMIFATNSLILRNAPCGLNAVGHSRIWLGYSALHGNAKARCTSDDGAMLSGPEVIEADPRVDARYRPAPGSPLPGHGDPDLGNPPGTPSVIGPGTGP